MTCSICGKKHWGKPCYKEYEACPGYEKHGHMIWDCPKNKKFIIGKPEEENKEDKQKPRVQGRMFAMTHQNTQTTSDVVTRLLRTLGGNNVIWVIVDQLTKSAHFLPIKVNFSIDHLASLYLREIIRRHGVLVSIVSDRNPHFPFRFWHSLQKALNTKLNFSTVFHP